MKLRHKLLAWLIAAATLSAFAVAAVSYTTVRDAVEERYTERLRAETALLATWISREQERAEGGGINSQALASRWGRLLRARVTLVSDDGVVVGDSKLGEEGLPLLDNHANRPEILAARSEEIGETRRRSDSTGLVYFYTAHRVEGRGPIAFARVAMPEREIRRIQLGYLVTLSGLTTLALSVLSLICYLGVRRLSQPVEQVTARAEAIASGELELPLDARGTTEISRLSRAIGRMRDSLVGKISELQRRQSLFDAVIGTMQEGLMVVGQDRRVRLVNPAFGRIFRIADEPEGRLVGEVLRHPTLLSLIETCAEESNRCRQRIESVGGEARCFDAEVAPVIESGGDKQLGVFVLLFDVTRLEALEETRKEFVANVSHELRTPLTSIKAAAATLLEGALQEEAAATHFLKTIDRNSERMGDLVSDLTDLSQIETGSIALEIQRVDVGAMIRDLVGQVLPKYEHMRLDVQIDVPSPHFLNVDQRRFEQVLVNLIDNAMKFNSEGGFVRITAEGSVIKVQDSGPGIPSDSLEKVFQRFYRVDPDRSRERGGTGLGLAIVKHLVTLHGGRVHAESEFGEGSTFVLDLNPS